jgi:hypothetical protein
VFTYLARHPELRSSILAAGGAEGGAEGGGGTENLPVGAGGSKEEAMSLQDLEILRIGNSCVFYMN